MRRFLKYVAVGATTFGLDLALLFLFAEILNWNYVLSAGTAYVIAITINYLFSRQYVFVGSLRSEHVGYAIFLLIAGVGFLLVSGFMYVFVQFFAINLFVSRVFVAGIAGIWNYVMNLYVNFKVNETELEGHPVG